MEKQQSLKTQSFIQIAQDYDFLNDLLSFGQHRLWKRKLVKELIARSDGALKVIDIATGTGDLLSYFAKFAGPLMIRAEGIDPCEQMLERARQKKIPADWTVTGGESLPFKDESFNVMTCTFGPRNMDNLDRAIKEWNRVLQKGAVLGVLESHPIEPRFYSFVFHWYWKYIVPLIGSVLSKRSAYEYLRDSSAQFLSRKEMLESFKRGGFEVINSFSLLPAEQVSYSVLVKK
jgi:demethylmenaquinone methyltransferase/2-methoxy-6-polyprenyl-1,4-benzoquinol methylase